MTTHPAIDGGLLRLVIDEIDMPNATVRDYGREVGRRIAENQWHPTERRYVEISGDPQGGDANLGYETTRYEEFVAGLREHGIEHEDDGIPASPLVSNRVAVTNRALEMGRILVHPRCDRLIKDRREVQWNKSGTGLDKGRDGSQTHFADADDYDIFRHWGARVAAPQYAVASEPTIRWPHEREPREDWRRNR
jgi:hypothetical protein